MSTITTENNQKPMDLAVFHCPSSPATPRKRGVLGEGVFNEHYQSGDYAGPSEHRDGNTNPGFSGIFRGDIHLIDLSHPSNMIRLFDKGIKLPQQMLGTFAIRYDEVQNFRGWHNDEGKNVLYFDGHVQFVDGPTLDREIPIYTRPGPLGPGSLWDQLDPFGGSYRIQGDRW